MDLLTFIMLSAFLSSQPNTFIIQVSCSSPSKPPPLFDTTTPFEFSKPMDFNSLGISTTSILHMEFKYGEKSSLWRTNPQFVDEELLGVFHEICGTPKNVVYSEKEGDNLNWGNCTFSDNQITILLEQGTGESWNKNISYVEITRKPFQKFDENGVEKTCILDEYTYTKAYVVMVKNVFHEPNPDAVNEPIYKLDAFLPFAKDFFREIIDLERIIQFYPIDFLNQTKRYKCLLALTVGESAEKINEICKFSCRDTKKEKKKEERVEL